MRYREAQSQALGGGIGVRSTGAFEAYVGRHIYPALRAAIRWPIGPRTCWATRASRGLPGWILRRGSPLPSRALFGGRRNPSSQGAIRVRVSFAVADNYDAVPSSAAYLVQVKDRGSPRGSLLAWLPVFAGQEFEPADLDDDGVWELRVSATDFVLKLASAVSGRLRSSMTSSRPGPWRPSEPRRSWACYKAEVKLSRSPQAPRSI